MPFSFRGLPSYSSAEAAIHLSFLQYLSSRPLKEEFRTALGQGLEAVFSQPVHIDVPHDETVRAQDLDRLIPQHSALFLVGVAPQSRTLLVEIEPQLLKTGLDRVLGGQGRFGGEARPFSELELGAVSYVGLKVLSLFAQGWQQGQQWTLTLNQVSTQLESFKPVLEAESGFQMLSTRVKLGDRVGYARILLPHSLLRERFGDAVAEGPIQGPELDDARQRFAILGDTKIWGRLCAAEVDLSPEELSELENGDIVLLERHQLALEQRKINGVVDLKFGEGAHGKVIGVAFEENGQYLFRIEEIVSIERPDAVEPSGDLSNAGQTMDEMDAVDSSVSEVEDHDLEPSPDAQPPGYESDNLPETQGILRDVQSPVVVELGRIQLNANQLIRLKAGQILKLPRGSNDPVNLVTSGRLFAKGELVEIDGQLGVRLIQLTGES